MTQQQTNATIPIMEAMPATATTMTPMQIPDVILLHVMTFLPRHSYLPICHVSKRFRTVWRDLVLLKFEIGRRRRDDNEPNNEDDDEDEDPRHLYWTNPASNVYDQLYPATTNNKSTKAKATCTTHTPLRKNLLHYYLSCGLASTRATTKANANDEKENYCSSRASATAALNAILIRAASLGDTAGMSYLVDNDICGTTTTTSTTTTNSSSSNVGMAVCTAAASSGQLDVLIYAREVFGYPWDVRRAYEAADHGVTNGIDGCQSVLVYIYLNSDDDAVLGHHGAGMPV
mmetsp:Transcript_11091/g.23408  ORF Transcript_11091/g.23408 Transcript_11091/m.23408 type:complete len:288 (-) Transcript_11091:197-1060(-)